MEQNYDLSEYLKGALAGRPISRTNQQSEVACSFNRDGNSILQVLVPDSIATGEAGEVSVQVANLFSRNCEGVLTLQGEDSRRGATYLFQSGFEISADRKGAMITFVWRAPKYPTEVAWSATASFEGHMGIGLPGEKALTQVVE